MILGSSFESGYNSRGVLTQESKIIHYSEGIVCFCSLMNLVPISDPARENEGIILWISNKCPKFLDMFFILALTGNPNADHNDIPIVLLHVRSLLVPYYRA